MDGNLRADVVLVVYGPPTAVKHPLVTEVEKQLLVCAVIETVYLVGQVVVGGLGIPFRKIPQSPGVHGPLQGVFLGETDKGHTLRNIQQGIGTQPRRDEERISRITVKPSKHVGAVIQGGVQLAWESLDGDLGNAVALVVQVETAPIL